MYSFVIGVLLVIVCQHKVMTREGERLFVFVIMVS